MIEVLKQALDALESCGEGHITDGGNQWHDAKLVDTAIASLRQAIAELESQEPVAWCIWLCGGIVGFFDKQDEAIEEFRRRNQEYPDESRELVPLYTHPPQRTWERPWVSLTDEEIEQVWIDMCGPQRWAMHSVYARKLEAKLKEKNT